MQRPPENNLDWSLAWRMSKISHLKSKQSNCIARLSSFHVNCSRWTHLVVGCSDAFWHLVLPIDRRFVWFFFKSMGCKWTQSGYTWETKRWTDRRAGFHSAVPQTTVAVGRPEWARLIQVHLQRESMQRGSLRLNFIVEVKVRLTFKVLSPCKTWNSLTWGELEVWGKAGRCWTHQWSPHHKHSRPDRLWPVDSKHKQLFIFYVITIKTTIFKSTCQLSRKQEVNIGNN